MCVQSGGAGKQVGGGGRGVFLERERERESVLEGKFKEGKRVGVG